MVHMLEGLPGVKTVMDDILSMGMSITMNPDLEQSWIESDSQA